MEYGTYRISLSIGYSGADREDEIKVSDYFTEAQWYAMSVDEREEFITETMHDMLSSYVEYGFQLQD